MSFVADSLSDEFETDSKTRINGEDLVTFLKASLRYREFSDALLRQQVIDQAAESKQVEVHPQEIQEEADRVRRLLNLENVTDTLKWLDEQQVTPEDWERGIRSQLLANKLAESMFQKAIGQEFALRKPEFERVILYQIVVPYEQVAQELFYQIEENEISFYEAAHLYDIDQGRRQRCGFEGLIYRRDLSPEFLTAVFAATPRQVVVPIQTPIGFHLLWIEEFLLAELTEELRQEILQGLFQQWLADEVNYLRHC